MRREAGFSLLEVMVAGAVTATGLAGIAALLLQSMVSTSRNLERSDADRLAQELAALMEMTPAAVDVFLVPPPLSARQCDGASDCTPAEFATGAYKRWQVAVASTLPAGEATICEDSSPEDGSPEATECDGEGPVVIKLFWADESLSASGWHRRTRIVPR